MYTKYIVSAAMGIASLIAVTATGASAASTAAASMPYAPVGEATYAPTGYEQFCRENAGDCREDGAEARDIVLSKTAWRDLVALNDQVNKAIEPVTDEDNYGRAEYWTYTTNGKGDCEEYVLLKRKLLIDAGWPRSALLITVVRDKKGAGHAVLTVKTDRGEFILDNQEQAILPWQQTGYRYVKRQSQQNQNVWVSLGDTQTTPVVAANGQ